MNPSGDKTLPKIRQDLKILQSSTAEDGSKRWRLFDSIANKYFVLTPDTFTLLSLWDETLSVNELLKKLLQEGYELHPDNLESFIQFLYINSQS